MNPVAEPLVSLGFTQLEADIYAWLLEDAPATGYRIAQALRKPAPNIYKAIESLESKGAVMVDEGRGRRCRPVPPDELLSHLDRRFQRDRARAQQSLGRVGLPEPDDRVYRLQSVGAVFERARAMLSRAREIVIVDAFPAPLADIVAALEEAAARGVKVGVLTYAPMAIEGAHVVVTPCAETVLQRWRGQWLKVVVDGREHLVSQMDPDQRVVRQAIWSSSVDLSWVYHSAVSSELMLAELESCAPGWKTAAEARRKIAELQPWRALDAPGYRELAEGETDS